MAGRASRQTTNKREIEHKHVNANVERRQTRANNGRPCGAVASRHSNRCVSSDARSPTVSQSSQAYIRDPKQRKSDVIGTPRKEPRKEPTLSRGVSARQVAKTPAPE